MSVKTFGSRAVKNAIIPILLLLALTGTAGHAIAAPAVRAAAGVLDLRDHILSRDGPVEIRGDWEFYWEKFVPPESLARGSAPAPDAYLSTQRSWKGRMVKQKPLPGSGYATYRIKILLNRSEKPALALMMNAQDTAFNLYANGELVASAGVPGKNAAESRPEWKSQIAEIDPGDSTLNLVVHISNFQHARGGLDEKLVLGARRDIRTMRERAVALKLFIFGGLLMIALYHLVVFLLRRKEKSAFYFSLFCLCMAMRILFIEEHYFQSLFPSVSWAFIVRLTYLSFSLALPAFAFFLLTLFPQEIKKPVMWLFSGLALLYTLLIITAPPAVFTNLVLPFQIVILAGGLYALSALVLSALRRRDDALLFLIAFAFYFLCIINDTYHHRGIIHTAYFVPTGFLAFVFLQSVVLSRRYSKAFTRIEELFQEKTKLEGETLTFQTLSYIDSLTGLANRRRMDEYLRQEWQRSRRNGTALSMIMLDIDFFKQYNDRYGHPAGDEVLRAVAAALEKSARRPADFIARYGGEEFVVLLPDTGLDGAHALAEIIRKRIMELLIPHEGSSVAEVLTVSLGCASMVPTEEKTSGELLVMADRMLYDAKKAGRNRTVR